MIDLRQVELTLTPLFCAGGVISLATVGLHALARRVQRGSLPGLTAILADLQTLAESYHRILQGPNAFRVEVPSGGAWIGVVMRSSDGPAATDRAHLSGERRIGVGRSVTDCVSAS